VTSAYRANRKAEDEDIVRLNSVGLSLGKIAKTLDCHPTTITLRLKDMGIQPADTRRAFMESIYESMTPRQREWLENQLGPTHTIKDYVRNLLIERFISDQNPKPESQS
jgi:IS30 family transposase